MSRIRVCLMCGQISQQVELAGTPAFEVLESSPMLPRGNDDRWTVRVFYCAACHTPSVEAYPERMAESKRRELAGTLPDESPLMIEEGK